MDFALISGLGLDKADEETAEGTMVKDDTEPVKLLLQQLSDVHDILQREKTVRWNEFLRKVRAERRREGEAAVAAAKAAADKANAPLAPAKARVERLRVVPVLAAK